MDYLFYYFLVINIFGFIQIALDKRQAIKGKRRIPEQRLLAIVFLGGTVGSGLAMMLFRHKTAKKSYLLKFWFIVLVQISFFVFYIKK